MKFGTPLQQVGTTVLPVILRNRSLARCFKDDNASQWKSGKFDPRFPKNPKPPVTKISMGDYKWDPYPCTKYYRDTIILLCENAHQATCLVFYRAAWNAVAV